MSNERFIRRIRHVEIRLVDPAQSIIRRLPRFLSRDDPRGHGGTRPGMTMNDHRPGTSVNSLANPLDVLDPQRSADKAYLMIRKTGGRGLGRFGFIHLIRRTDVDQRFKAALGQVLDLIVCRLPGNRNLADDRFVLHTFSPYDTPEKPPVDTIIIRPADSPAGMGPADRI